MHHHIKELFEKLKAHAKKNNDPELDAILEEYKNSFEPMGDGDEGGNSPDQSPDLP